MGNIFSNLMESCDDCIYREHKTHIRSLEDRLCQTEEKFKQHIALNFKQMQSMRHTCCDD